MFPDELRRFDAHMQARGAADRTRAKYRYQLTLLWCNHLYERDRTLLEADPDDLEGYVAALPANGSARRDAIQAIRAFYGWAQHRLGDNPAASLRTPRPKVPPAPDIPDDELRRLLRAAFRREPRRGWAILLCYVTGARVGSLVALRPCDVHLDASPRVDFLEAKGGRIYSQPLPHAGVIAATHLLRGSRVVSHESHLLGVGAERFRQWIREAEREAGTRHVWPHLLRHAAATRVARSSDPETWRRFMNHVDLSQWARYVAGDDERVRDASGRLFSANGGGNGAAARARRASPARWPSSTDA